MYVSFTYCDAFVPTYHLHFIKCTCYYFCSHVVGGFDRLNAYASGALASAFALSAVEQGSRYATHYMRNLTLKVSS